MKLKSVINFEFVEETWDIFEDYQNNVFNLIKFYVANLLIAEICKYNGRYKILPQNYYFKFPEIEIDEID